MKATDSDSLPSGFKFTEAGLIPNDWTVARVDTHASIKTGAKNTQDREPDGIYPFYVRSDQVERINSYSSDGEAVLTAGDGVGTGKVFHYVNGRFDVHQRVYRINEFSSRLAGKYFFYHFSARFFSRIMSMTAKSSVDSVRMEMIAGMAIPLPAIAEQRAIAETLSDVDGLLGALDALIVKKRGIKQAAMQQLLTGRTRLPGFGGEWETRCLGEIGSFFKGRGIKRDEVSDDGVPCIRYGELYTRYNNYVTAPASRVPLAVARTALPIETGDLLFAGSGETAEEIGRCVAYLGEEKAYAGGDIVVMRPAGQNSLYLGHLMNHPMVAIQKARLGQGDAVVHISARNIAAVEVCLPPLDEQTAIAEVLSDIDAEIAALERRREKTRAIKQGMMQQLLTARIRLVRPVVGKINTPVQVRRPKGHNKHINEAVVISVLAKEFGSDQFPLGRKRYTKLAYLLHRHAEKDVEGYLKKAAGPYNPTTKYGGAERIAIQRKYVREHASGPFRGFVPDKNVAEAEGYFEKWYGADAKRWLEQFRAYKNEHLELVATVDMAIVELRRDGRAIDVGGVKAVIRATPEWQAKLSRPEFADAKIAKAIGKCRELFPVVAIPHEPADAT